MIPQEVLDIFQNKISNENNNQEIIDLLINKGYSKNQISEYIKEYKNNSKMSLTKNTTKFIDKFGGNSHLIISSILSIILLFIFLNTNIDVNFFIMSLSFLTIFVINPFFLFIALKILKKKLSLYDYLLYVIDSSILFFGTFILLNYANYILILFNIIFILRFYSKFKQTSTLLWFIWLNLFIILTLFTALFRNLIL